MKEATNFFENFHNKNLSSINTVLPGTIDRYDPVKMVADVVLSTGVLLVSVSVAGFVSGSHFIRIPYRKGDPVVVAFAQEDIDGFLFGDKAQPSQKKFRLDDAFVIGGIMFARDNLPDAAANELVLSNRKGTQAIVISDNSTNLIGNVFVNGVKV